MADASFLTSTRADPATSVAGEEAAMSSSVADAAAKSATAELYRTNLLRLETSELLNESTLHLSPFSGELDREVKWSDDVRKYTETIKAAIGAMGSTMLGPDYAAMPPSFSSEDEKAYWVNLDSDKFHKQGRDWSFPFSGGKSLQLEPVGEYGAGGAGMTNQRGNALCLPMVDLAVLSPSNNGNGEGDMIGGKDYLNGRYFDKQNILAVHIAKILSQKKHRKKIGAVHVSIDSSDLRRVVLILTPPLPEEVADQDCASGANERSKKRRKGHGDKDVAMQTTARKSGKTKSRKPRYRVRLIFGMQGNPSNRNFWIPPARLFPDRCNNRIESSTSDDSSGSSTPTYTSILARDIHHVAISRIIHSMSKACAAFNEALVLAKIWCLQRGLLRGHDALDTTSLALLLVYLYRTKKVGTRMGSIQVFTILMKFIAETDWLGEGTVSRSVGTGDDSLGNGDKIRFAASEGYKATVGNARKKTAIVLPEEGLSESKTIDHCAQSDLYQSDLRKTGSSGKSQTRTLLECYKVHSPGPVFLDPTMTVNYLASVSPSFVRELQGEAKNAIFSLHLHSDDPSGAKSPFRLLFQEGCRFWRRYDAYVHLDLNDMEKRSRLCQEFDNASDVGRYESISRSVVQLLRMALGDRVTAIRALTRGNGEGALLPIVTSALTDTDQAPSIPIRSAPTEIMATWGNIRGRGLSSPMMTADGQGKNKVLVIGLRINSQTCSRVVDRGPPANDTDATSAFVDLWGKEKAQLRRFKDGAIVHAVLWNIDNSDPNEEGYLKFSGDERCGGIVERVIRHIVPLHFAPRSPKRKNTQPLPLCFGLRNMMSLVEGVSNGNAAAIDRLSSGGVDSTIMHKDIMSAFDSLNDFLRQNSIAVPVTPGSKDMRSKLGLPLAIDAIEPLSSSLRYSEVFPPQAHRLLGGVKRASDGGTSKAAGVTNDSPILIQIRLEGNSKWPNDVKAISAAKCALLIQLAEGIETMKRNGASECSAFDGPIHVTPSYMDVGYRGYSWRIMIRADQELKLLNSLRKPTPEAIELRTVLNKRHIISALHHSTVHSVNTQYPSAGLTMRLAMRWVHSHMLSGLLTQEAVEILVGKVFVDAQPLEPPATPMSGFLRFLRLLSSHDWARQPLIFDPQGGLAAEDYARVQSDFEAIRGEGMGGPPMFLITLGCVRFTKAQPMPGIPDVANRQRERCIPTFARESPEQVVLSRVIALAKRSELFLLNLLAKGESIRLDGNNSWASVFHESASSLKSYSVLLRVDPHIVVDPGSSSTEGDSTTKITEDGLKTPFTRSAIRRSVGPKSLRIHTYKNVGSSVEAMLHGWCPIANLVDTLRAKFGSSAVFFYNALAPDIIALLWRPTTFSPVAFTAMHSEFKRPMENEWREDGLAMQNAEDLLRKICHIADSSVKDVKILDDRSVKAKPTKSQTSTSSTGGGVKKRKATNLKSEVSSASSSSSSEDDSSSDEDD